MLCIVTSTAAMQLMISPSMRHTIMFWPLVGSHVVKIAYTLSTADLASKTLQVHLRNHDQQHDLLRSTSFALQSRSIKKYLCE